LKTTEENRVQPPTIFYLHGGPGLGTAFERQRYPDADNVHWWQQPPAVSCATRPYQDLLAATLAEFRLSVDMLGAPMTIMASSFGAHLAMHLAREMPASIARIVLLAPTFNPEEAALRLARHGLALHAADANAGKLAAALADYEAAPGRARFWDVMGALWLLPNVTSLYFGPDCGDEPQVFAYLLQQPGVFDGPSSVATSDDFASNLPKPARSPYEGPVSVIFGEFDPMIDAERDAAIWRTVFPQAEIHTVPTGHFPLLELSIEACLNPGRKAT
jgi:pimeloyl-ACP methyl ester carboxylesterase